MKIALWLLLALAIVVALMAAFPQRAAQIAFSLERGRSGLELKSVVVNGETWHYLEGGAADVPVLLLLHGFGGDKDNWTRFSRTLVRDYRFADLQSTRVLLIEAGERVLAGFPPTDQPRQRSPAHGAGAGCESWKQWPAASPCPRQFPMS